MREKILKLATNFRNALEATNKENLFITLKDFPLGSCGDASLLLARYLKENDIDSIYYTYGFKNKFKDSVPKRTSHAWLEYKNLIIDITANQFDEIDEKVIVNTNSQFHVNYKIRDRFKADYRSRYRKELVMELDYSYSEIIKNIPKINEPIK